MATVKGIRFLLKVVCNLINGETKDGQNEEARTVLLRIISIHWKYLPKRPGGEMAHQPRG